MAVTLSSHAVASAHREQGEGASLRLSGRAATDIAMAASAAAAITKLDVSQNALERLTCASACRRLTWLQASHNRCALARGAAASTHPPSALRTRPVAVCVRWRWPTWPACPSWWS